MTSLRWHYPDQVVRVFLSLHVEGHPESTFMIIRPDGAKVNGRQPSRVDDDGCERRFKGKNERNYSRKRGRIGIHFDCLVNIRPTPYQPHGVERFARPITGMMPIRTRSCGTGARPAPLCTTPARTGYAADSAVFASPAARCPPHLPANAS